MTEFKSAAAIRAQDDYDRNTLLSFYVSRVRAILDSGDPVRIQLFCEWLEREGKRMGV